MRADAKQLARAGYTYIGRLYSEMDCQMYKTRHPITNDMGRSNHK